MACAVVTGTMHMRRRDLLERSATFSGRLIRFSVAERKRGRIPQSLLQQALRAGTAIGAHSAEADAAITRRHLLALRAGALKEALETEYWLDVIAAGGRCQSPQALADLRNQLSPLIAILTACVKKLRGQ